MQFWQHRRAVRRLPRVRSVRKSQEPSIDNIVAFKAGMTRFTMVDDTESPSKQLEVNRACTVLEIPETEVYGVRLYSIDPTTKYRRTSEEIYSKQLAQKAGVKTVKKDESALEQIKAKANDFVDVSLLLVSSPKALSTGQNHNNRFEAKVSGKDINEKIAFAAGLLGKRINPGEVFKPGEFVDLVSITRGKGWAGVIKRFGVARLNHKATQKTRHVGTHGAFTPGKVLFGVPQAGQMGFNYRSEHNKRIVKVGTKNDAAAVNIASGFKNYGVVKNDYILIDGSVPGPAKRLVRVRKSVGNRNAKGIKEPKVTYIETMK
ncbi:MAG: 50S ribosomal protein L3 [Candidatus Micrarchaeota archaeon]|nr:50S ribosomal protein L3 [Candidatus Micrarchaeota archaeon]